MRRFAAVLGGLSSISSVVAIAAAPTPAPVPAASGASTSSVSTAVGPAASGPARPAASGAAQAAAPGEASASQVVTGTVASTTGVRVDASMQPSYSGTEPATMTVTHGGSQVTVTVVPR